MPSGRVDFDGIEVTEAKFEALLADIKLRAAP